MLIQNFGVTNQEHYGMLWYFWSGQFNKCLENLENLKSGDETLHLMLDIVHQASKILNTFLTLRKKIALNSRATSFHRVVESEKLAPRISN